MRKIIKKLGLSTIISLCITIMLLKLNYLGLDFSILFYLRKCIVEIIILVISITIFIKIK